MGDREMDADGLRVCDVVRDVVAEIAAEELPVVDGLAALDEAAVARGIARRRSRQDPLGFGLNEMATLATPVVWLAVNEAARQFGSEAANGAVRGVRAVARRILRRPAEPAVVPALSHEQLREVHELVLQTAAQRGLSERRAEEIADAVVARLAITAPGTNEVPGGGDATPAD